MKKTLLLLFFFTCLGIFSDPTKHGISYSRKSAARFGDQLLLYTQARYLSFITKVPFFYKLFVYSEYLSIEHESQPLNTEGKRFQARKTISNHQDLTELFKIIRDPDAPPTLFIIQYFPAEISEWENDPSRNLLLNIPWFDQEFSSYLNRSIQPKISIPDFTIEGKLNVAVHVRTLSGTDTKETSWKAFPLKHPSIDYHIRQIQKVYKWNLERPMHVFIFSDTNNPQELLDSMRNYFQGANITFNIQYNKNVDTDFVIHDFFAMQKFNVLIATQSNFSMMASRLKQFDMTIFPVHHIGTFPNTKIDRVQVISKKTDWFPFELNAVLKESLRPLHATVN